MINILRPRQNCRHFADDMFKCIFLNKDVSISLKISLKFVHMDRIDSVPALVQIMDWRRPGHKPSSKPLMVSFLTDICVTRPRWVSEEYFPKYNLRKFFKSPSHPITEKNHLRYIFHILPGSLFTCTYGRTWRPYTWSYAFPNYIWSAGDKSISPRVFSGKWNSSKTQ